MNVTRLKRSRLSSTTQLWQWVGYAPLDADLATRSLAALGDISEGVRRWQSWTYLAASSVKNQYRRTVIGPWWITLQTAAYVLGLAILFGAIFHEALNEFVPYVAVGFIGFTLLSGLTRQGAEVFVNNSSVIKSTRQPLSVLVFRAVTIEFLQFAHNMVILIAFVVLGQVKLSALTLLIVPAVLVILVNGVAIGLWLGPTVARFRDVGPFVLSILQMLVFFTPIFWRVDTLHPDNRAALVGWNPFAYLLDAFRDPMLGGPLVASTYVGVGIITLANVLLAGLVFSRMRSRLPYWVA
jgi:ABC-type polysaccharide/polyol phosphate export permease